MNQKLSTDTTLSHYRLVKQIGAGGMGEVYRAREPRLRRKSAAQLKTFASFYAITIRTRVLA
jgi:hypothetical protein